MASALESPKQFVPARDVLVFRARERLSLWLYFEWTDVGIRYLHQRDGFRHVEPLLQWKVAAMAEPVSLVIS